MKRRKHFVVIMGKWNKEKKEVLHKDVYVYLFNIAKNYLWSKKYDKLDIFRKAYIAQLLAYCFKKPPAKSITL